ncbi:MAG: hypothetical protein MUE67_12675, partial [Anaerolineales bacterium]|nr:hypothetical protein [Anaerolineales bacterium]
MTGRKYTSSNWLIYLLILAILLASCGPLQPLATAEPPSPQPSPSPAPTATPDPYRSFEQQLEAAAAAGSLPASYTSDPGGAPVLMADVDLTPFRESGLLPLSADGQELGRINGEQLSLPRLEAIPYPVSLPTSLADLVGVFSAPGKDPALVAAKLMPDGSIKITPIVFTEGEDVVFGAKSVIIAGQEVFYNQLTSAWEPLLTHTPEELKYDIGDDGKTLIIDGQ